LRDGFQKIEILLVVRLLRAPRPEHEQRQRRTGSGLAGNRDEQLDAVGDQQVAFLD
jgi:hypothetical protein